MDGPATHRVRGLNCFVFYQMRWISRWNKICLLSLTYSVVRAWLCREWAFFACSDGCGGKVREAVSQECRAWHDNSASLETQQAKTKGEATGALNRTENVSTHASALPGVGSNSMYIHSESSLASMTRPFFARWSCYRCYRKTVVFLCFSCVLFFVPPTVPSRAINILSPPN